MSLDQGQTDPAASFVPPQRTPVEFDPESNGLRIGPYERRIDDPGDSEQVFGAYISLLYAVRGAQPGEQLKLRSADLEALLLIVGDDPETIEQRLMALMGCTAQEARVLGGALLRHRRLTATLGIAGALALGGSIAGDDLFSGTSEAPRAAVVQSVADGLRALDDAGASRGSVSFAAPSADVSPASVSPASVSPASVSMPTDDWTGSKPVGGTPDVPAGTSSGPDGGAVPAGAPDVSAGTPAAPVADVPAGTPAAPAAAAPSVVDPPAAESPALAPPVVVTNPVPIVESVVEQPGSGVLPSGNDVGAGGGAAAPVDSTPTADTDPLADTDPIVDSTPLVDGTPPGDTTSSSDPTIPVVDDSEAAPVTGGPAVPGTGSAPGLDGALPPGAEHVPDGVTAPGLGGALPDGAAAAPGTGNAPGLGGTPPGGGNGMPGALDVLPGVPLVLPVVVTPPPPPVIVTPVVVTPEVDPTVHDNRDKLKNTNSGGGNDGVDVDRDDNGKHGQTGQHVENGKSKSNSAGGVVP